MPPQGNFEHYQLLKHEDGSFVELGHGAMGVTYKAFDTNLQCNVALKVISAAYLNDPTAGERFLREARGAARLRHRNVASVFHLGRNGDSYFYSMEFIEGETLDAMIKREGALDLVDALDVAAQVSNALIAAAKQNLIHRDIKPSNLMLTREDDGEMIVKVIDFGLVKSAMVGSTAGALTSTGFVGTPYFASPEQLDQQDEDIRSDIYSLGVTLWFMLTGRPTFMGSVASVIAQHMEKTPSFDSLAVLPSMVVDVLRRMLEKDLSKRFQNPTELRVELKRCIEALRGSQTSAGAALPLTGNEGFQTVALSSTHGFKSAASGTVLAERYRLIEDLNPGNPGHTFHAEDVSLKRRVCLRMVRGDAASFVRVQEDAERSRNGENPNWIEVLAALRAGALNFVVLEWMEGFSLVDLLRVRRELTLREALTILDQVAAAADEARDLGLLLELELRDIFLHFPEGFGQSDPSILLRCPIAEWPAFLVKLNPLGCIQEVETSAGEAAERTMIAAPQRNPGADVTQVGKVAYELLGGKPGRFAPLANLSEPGNEALRECVASNGKFSTAREFVSALGGNVEASKPWIPSGAQAPVADAADAPKAERATSPAPQAAPPPASMTPAQSGTGVPPVTVAIPSKLPAPKPSASLMPLIACIVGIVAVIGGGLAWIFGSGHSPTTTTPIADTGMPSVPSVKAVTGRKPPQPGVAWTNSLDMEFVPLGDIHFGANKTRVRDFKAFVDADNYEAIGGMSTHQKDGFKDHGNNSWEKPGFIQTSEDPVVGVSYNDAKHFCDWLTAKERREGSLRADQAYRLPTDQEWSEAVGLPVESGATPEERSGRIKGFPWGSVWPPPPNVRNYAGAESRAGFGSDWQVIPAYSDLFQRTSPARKFGPAKNGIYDLGGNAWEWVQDHYNKTFRWRTLRGGSWATAKQEQLLSSYRLWLDPSFRQDDAGFRCVLGLEEENRSL